jgi:hypothetical protein
MPRLIVRAAVVGAVALTVVGVAAAATYRGISPVYVSGNPTCSDIPNLAYTHQVKFDPTVHGASADGIYLFFENGLIGWYTLGDVAVKAVIIKGGTGANVYVYPGTDFSDGWLEPPRNPKNGKLYDLGYSAFCY